MSDEAEGGGVDQGAIAAMMGSVASGAAITEGGDHALIQSVLHGDTPDSDEDGTNDPAPPSSKSNKSKQTESTESDEDDYDDGDEGEDETDTPDDEDEGDPDAPPAKSFKLKDGTDVPRERIEEMVKNSARVSQQLRGIREHEKQRVKMTQANEATTQRNAELIGAMRKMLLKDRLGPLTDPEQIHALGVEGVIQHEQNRAAKDAEIQKSLQILDEWNSNNATSDPDLATRAGSQAAFKQVHSLAMAMSADDKYADFANENYTKNIVIEGGKILQGDHGMDIDTVRNMVLGNPSPQILSILKALVDAKGAKPDAKVKPKAKPRKTRSAASTGPDKVRRDDASYAQRYEHLTREKNKMRAKNPGFNFTPAQETAWLNYGKKLPT